MCHFPSERWWPWLFTTSQTFEFKVVFVFSLTFSVPILSCIYKNSLARVTRCFLPLLLLSLYPVSIKSSMHSFFITCSIISTSFYRTTFLLLLHLRRNFQHSLPCYMRFHKSFESFNAVNYGSKYCLIISVLMA